MAGALASFTASGNNPDGCCPLPRTPFQVLYVDPATATFNETADNPPGLETFGSNTFPNVPGTTVHPGTIFYLPVINADDSGAFPGPYPSSHRDAAPYLFDQEFYGGSFQVTIDGRTTTVGGEYVAGPVTTVPLPDGGGTHMITLGAFVGPLTPGTHKVSITGGVSGTGFQAAYGLSFLTEADSYTIHVG
jgi:hypothetical protein